MTTEVNNFEHLLSAEHCKRDKEEKHKNIQETFIVKMKLYVIAYSVNGTKDQRCGYSE